MDADPHLLSPDLLPTPFTADEIRAATGAGTTIRLLVDSPDGSHHERINRLHETDADGATLDAWFVEFPDDVLSTRVTWTELQEHAAFRVGHTVESAETLDLPIGRVTCRRYDTNDGPDAPVETYWFSPAHPGMPVRYEVPLDGGILRTTVRSIVPA